MWILRVFSIGFYSILLWPFHIPLWCTGYLIRDKANSPKGRGIWLGILTSGLILCELTCWYILQGFDRWGGFIAIAVVLDLLIGYAAAALPPFFRKCFRQYMQYLETDDEKEESL